MDYAVFQKSSELVVCRNRMIFHTLTFVICYTTDSLRVTLGCKFTNVGGNMILINEEKCTGCGSCVRDCFMKAIEIVDKKAKFKNTACLECGHCVAVCPSGATCMENYNMAEVEDVQPLPFTGDALLHVMKSRRSVRRFLNRAIEAEKMAKLIEIGRYSPTGGNRQSVQFIIVEKEMAEFRRLVIEALGKMGAAMIANEHTPQQFLVYANMWVRTHAGYKENPEAIDAVFLGAPNVMLFADASQMNVGVAASRIELAAHAYGIGSVYSGFIARACQDPEVKKFLGLDENVEVPISLVLGYNNIHYFRTVPRKAANVTWK